MTDKYTDLENALEELEQAEINHESLPITSPSSSVRWLCEANQARQKLAALARIQLSDVLADLKAAREDADEMTQNWREAIHEWADERHRLEDDLDSAREEVESLRSDWAREMNTVSTLTQRLADVEKLLIERDGGDHDADCKVHRNYGCNCGHDAVKALSQVADSKECEHGKGLADYCQPCGRVNGG